MDWKMLAVVFGTVFLAELGDKTQLATVLFATDKDVSKWLVFVFFCSVGTGVLLAGLLLQFRTVTTQISKWKKSMELPHEQYYTEWLRSKGVTQARDVDLGLGNINLENLQVGHSLP